MYRAYIAENQIPSLLSAMGALAASRQPECFKQRNDLTNGPRTTDMTNKMARNIAIANRIREVLLNGHWIANTNYKEQIQSVNWQQATQKVDRLNTIAGLTYHINYYLAETLSAFENGSPEISDKYSFDLPAINYEIEWSKLVSEFLTNSEKFADKIEKMDENIFDLPFIDEKYGTLMRNIEGVIEHSCYHLG